MTASTRAATLATRVRALGERSRVALIVIAVLAIAALGLTALHRLTEEVSLNQVRHAYNAIPTWRIGAALGFTALSYLALTFYDVIALRIIDRPLPWRTAAFASFSSYTLSHNFGLALLTGGSARYRIYTNAGLDSADVARVIAFASAAFWIGVAVVAGVAMVGGTDAAGPLSRVVPAAWQRPIGAAILLAVAAALLIGPGVRRLSVFGWSLPVPSRGEGLAQLVVAIVDLGMAGTALYILLPNAAEAGWATFFLGYAVALVVALVSHVPGGIGVFEAIIVATVPGDAATTVAALIVYRLVYYVLPLGVAAVMLAVVEGRRWRRPIGRALDDARSVAGSIAPLVAAALTFGGGAVLLVSGSLPALPGRMRDLHGLLPLPFVEASHIAASLAGTALLMLAPGLYRRLDGAFIATRALLVAGAVFSLAKGLDYEEAVVLLAILALMQWCRPAFYRRTALTAEPLSPSWIAAILTAVLLSLWIGIFSYKHVAYSDQLWWQFAVSGDASRFLRASVAIGVLLACAVLARLLSPGRVADPGLALDPQVAAAALAQTSRTDAMLAFTGDKRFLVSAAGDAFLMYQVKGSSWIVMGDPVGPEGAWAELLWAIRTCADAAQGRLLLYQISADALPITIELGLQLVKYGESACVDLTAFTLDGPARRPIRHAVRRAEREGLSFGIVAAADLPAIMPALAAISDAWLADKGAVEKGFSVGRFDPDYIARFDCAVARRDGDIVAFANIWATPNRAELSIDLMRHATDAPAGTMDYLLAQLMLWGHREGYAAFALGMAPLSGIEAKRLSPAWAKGAAFLFRHGNRFYGFEGLRAYKEKFVPDWTPRYIAAPQGVGLLRALADLQSLIGRDAD